MDFKSRLETLPSIDHLKGIDIVEGERVIHHIPAVAGKLGSLRVYHALYQEFDGSLNRTSAQKGIFYFAEHAEDAQHNPTKHPNIDLLFRIINEELSYQIKLLK